MRLAFAVIVAVLSAVPVSAQSTLFADRFRLNAGPCVLTSTAGSPDTLVLTGDCSQIGTSPATNLTLKPTGDLVLSPDGVDVLPNTNYTVNLGMLSNKYLTLHAAELWVETLVAQNTIATIGGRVLVAPTNILTVDLAAGGTTISVKYNNLNNGDRVYMEAAGKVEFMAVASAASGSGPFTYTVTRNLDGSGANQWFAGDAILNTGTTGNGFIDLYSTAGVLSSGSGPAIVGNVRTGTTYNAYAPRWAIGNLNGLYGYGATTYGTAFGDPTATNITIDATNGIRMRRSGTTNAVSIDTAGNIIIGDPSGNKLTYTASTGSLVLAGANGNQLNQIRNSECRVGTEDWTGFTNSGLTYSLASSLATWRLNEENNTCYFTITGTPAAATASQASESIVHPVQEGSYYEASAYLGVHRSGDTAVVIQWLDDMDAQISISQDPTPCTLASAGGTQLDGYCRSHVIAVAPSGAVNAKLIIGTTHIGGSPAGTDPYVFWVRSFFGEATATQTIPSAWGPGGITEITGGMIRTGTIVAGHIAANTITASQIAAGTITATQIAAGTITADRMNVSSLSAISANIGTITGGSISGTTIDAAGTVTLNGSGITITTGPGSSNQYKFSGGAYIGSNSSQIDVSGSQVNLASSSRVVSLNTAFISQASSADLGTSGTPWPNLYLGNLQGGGNRLVCADNNGHLYPAVAGAC